MHPWTHSFGSSTQYSYHVKTLAQGYGGIGKSQGLAVGIFYVILAHCWGEHHATTRWELGWTPFVCVIPWCTQGGWDTPCILPHVPWVQWLKQLNVITNSDRTDFVTSSSSIASPRRQRAGAVFSVSWWHVDWLLSNRFSTGFVTQGWRFWCRMVSWVAPMFITFGPAFVV